MTDKEERELRTEERKLRKEFLDKCFEFLKHMTTVSTAAGLVILAVFSAHQFRVDLLGGVLLPLALCAVSSVYGMVLVAEAFRHFPTKRKTARRHVILASTLVQFSALTFIVPVLFFAIGMFGASPR